MKITAQLNFFLKLKIKVIKIMSTPPPPKKLPTNNIPTKTFKYFKDYHFHTKVRIPTLKNLGNCSTIEKTCCIDFFLEFGSF